MLDHKDTGVNFVQSGNSVGRTSLAIVVGWCLIGAFLFILAAIIVLSLIPVYLHTREINVRHTSTTSTTSTTSIISTNANASENSFFVFDFINANSGISVGRGGRTVAATAGNFPALIGNGVAMTVGFISGCGINLPHTHPRATEINIIVSGEFETGVFQENNARFIMQTVSAGQATVFPQGAIHFEQNLNCDAAVFVAGFNSDDPGVQTVASSLFGGLPANVVGASLGGLNITSVDDLKLLLPANPALGIQLCRQRCGFKS